MKNWIVLGTMILLSVFTVAWSRSQMTQAERRAAASQKKLENVSKLASQIQSLKSGLGTAMTIAPADYDPFRQTIIGALEKAKIKNPATARLTSSPLATRKDVPIELRNILDPIKTPVTLNQLMTFLEEVHSAPINMTCNSISLTPAKQSENEEKEMWNATFSLQFLRAK